MSTKKLWKTRLYDAYVSSGQASTAEDGNRLFAQRAPYIKSIIHKHIPSDKNVRILDLGCGHGTFLYFLKQASYHNIWGVDASSEQVALAHKLGIEEVKESEIGSFLATVEDETIGVVLLMDVLEHLTRQELFDLLDEVFRVLILGGKCIVHVPNAEGLSGMRIRYGDMTHELAFTPQSIRQVFSVVGMQDVQCFEDKPVSHGIVSFGRWIIWELLTFSQRLTMSAETGGVPGDFILSANMLVVALKSTYKSNESIIHGGICYFNKSRDEY